VSTPNILARKSEGGLLPYCKIGAKSEGYNRPGPLVSLGTSNLIVLGFALVYYEMKELFVDIIIIIIIKTKFHIRNIGH
jgi:hypothetical protein